ncbi:putative ERG4/ERG24 ergosterol biosynthesis protein [Trichoderma ceciliae]
MVATKHKYEFGGPLGTGALVFGLPVLLYFFYFTFNDITGCPAPALLEPRSLSLAELRSQVPWPEDGIRGFASWRASGWMIIYYLLSLVLYRVLPGQVLYGIKLRESGRPLKYKLNAFSSTIVQLAACVVGTLLYGADFVVWTFIDEHYLQLYTANLIFAFAISLFVYVRSFSVRPGNREMRELAQGGHTGNIMYDFFIGRELNPRITLPFFGEIDLKVWLEMRLGLTGWILLDLAFVAKQYRTFEYVSDSTLVVAIVQGYYVLEGQYAESGILVMMDTITDGLGFMLTFGDIVWVPLPRLATSLATHYSWAGRESPPSWRFLPSDCTSSVHPTHKKESFARGLKIPVSRTCLIYKRSEAQDYLPTDGGESRATSTTLETGCRLRPFSLPTDISGYMILPAGTVATAGAGVATMLDGREVIQGAARGWGTIYTYFYVVYFASLLIHRERRDDAACAEKYGEDWDKYKNAVKWRILPGIY